MLGNSAVLASLRCHCDYNRFFFFFRCRFFVVFSCLALSVFATIKEYQAEAEVWLFYMEIVVVIWFSIEFFLRSVPFFHKSDKYLAGRDRKEETFAFAFCVLRFVFLELDFGNGKRFYLYVLRKSFSPFRFLLWFKIRRKWITYAMKRVANSNKQASKQINK